MIAGAVIAPAVALGLAVAGVAFLRGAWRERAGGWRSPLGWLALVAGAVAWRWSGAAWDKAIGLAMLAPSLAALVLLASSVQRPRRGRKPASESRPAAEPAVGPGKTWRGVVRALLAGPLAMVTAMGLSSALALRAPWVEADRFVFALLVLPLAWAAGAIWATTDARLSRVTAGLGLVALATFGAAAL